MSTSIGWRLIGRNLAVHKGAVARALLWSGVASLPALLSGLLIAAALNHGFLVGDTTVGLACLGALIPLFGLSAFATCRLFPWCAEVVEGVRDNLVTTVATGAITSSTEFSASGGRNVARCVEQVEVVRNLLAALARSLRQLVMPIVAALIGLAVLSPILAAVVAPPVLLSMALYVRVVRRVAARQRAGAIADEQLAEQGAAVFAGMRDVTAHGAGEWATTRLVGAAKTSAAATSAVAKANTARALVVALGAQLPLLAVLGVAAVLVPDGRLSIGAAVGAVTYVTTALAPALRTMVHSGGGWLVQLGVLTGRIAETAADVPANEPVDPVDLGAAVASATAPERIPAMALAAHGLRFRYGAGADDVVNGLDLLVPAGDHLAIVGPSGGGKSTLALLLAAVLTPTEGSVSLDGRALQEWTAAERHRPLPLSRSRRTFSPEPCRRTLRTFALRPPPNRWSRPLPPLGSGPRCSASVASMPSCRPEVRFSPRERASLWRWPGPGCRLLRSLSSMRRPAISTAGRRHGQKQPSGRGAGASSLSPTVSVPPYAPSEY